MQTMYRQCENFRLLQGSGAVICLRASLGPRVDSGSSLSYCSASTRALVSWGEALSFAVRVDWAYDDLGP